MTAQTETSSSGWTVLSQTEGNDLTTPGQVSKIVTVTAQTGHGNVFTVDIPAARYHDTAWVYDQIGAKASQVDAVQGLSAPQG